MSIDPKLAGNVIQVLTNVPDFLRKLMLRNKLQEFYSMTDLDKHETISTALNALPLVDSKKLSMLTKTWLEILSEFEGVKITTMFRIYCEEFLKNSTIIEKLDIKLMADAFSLLPYRNRKMLTDCLKEAIFSLPKTKEVVRIIPKPVLKILEME
ncbi:MAG: hypothetical protein JO327_00235 [Nitrososphaeraceae archaeon]|nr:hypothetical protein [Nitrososphaeraceae archaeon]